LVKRQIEKWHGSFFLFGSRGAGREIGFAVFRDVDDKKVVLLIGDANA
jgi:hypothetical protein